MEGSKGSVSKPYEKYFAFLIALSAALSGLAGYMSAEATRNANVAGVLSMKWQTEASAAYDSATQIIIRDQQLLADAWAQDAMGDLQGDPDYHIIANQLRNLTDVVDHDYLYYDGTPTYRFSSYEHAWNTYVNDMYQNYDNYMEISDDHTKEGQHQLQRANSFLLATVILAFGTVVAAAGISLSQRKFRFVMLLIVLTVLLITLAYMLSIA